MTKVTVVTGPQGSGKTTEVNKLIADRPVMYANSSVLNKLRTDEFCIHRLIGKAIKAKAEVIVMQELWVDTSLLRTLFISLMLGNYPVDVIFETQMAVQTIPCKSYVDLIVKTKPEKKTGLGIISEERQRQITVEDYSLGNDEQYVNCELAFAAVCYAMPETHREMQQTYLGEIPWIYPFDPTSWKPTPENRIRELAKAGALIAAEIDRILNLPKSDYNAKDN